MDGVDEAVRHFKLLILVIVGLSLQVATARGQAAAARIALVIGNSAYAEAPLANPANDARLMAETLRGLGFDVIERIDANRKTIQLATFELQDRLLEAGKDAVGLFYGSMRESYVLDRHAWNDQEVGLWTSRVSRCVLSAMDARDHARVAARGETRGSCRAGARAEAWRRSAVIELLMLPSVVLTRLGAVRTVGRARGRFRAGMAAGGLRRVRYQQGLRSQPPLRGTSQRAERYARCRACSHLTGTLAVSLRGRRWRRGDGRRPRRRAATWR